MRIKVNGVRLYVDIDGAGLVADGHAMRTKPTLIALHGGPGADHSIFKPDLGALRDLCQIIYLDHRGNGRSDDGDINTWTLAQWGDDIAGLCDVLGIEKPLIYGASFGGFVAQSYATRHSNIGGLILESTTAHVDFEQIFAAFANVADPDTGQIARTYWNNPTPELRAAYRETCLPFYTTRTLDPNFMARIVGKDPVGLHFNGPQNEMGRFDFRPTLGNIACPTLILAGTHDPIMPRIFSDDIARLIPQATYKVLENAGHLLNHDAPDAFMRYMRQFISENSHAA